MVNKVSWSPTVKCFLFFSFRYYRGYYILSILSPRVQLVPSTRFLISSSTLESSAMRDKIVIVLLVVLVVVERGGGGEHPGLAQVSSKAFLVPSQQSWRRRDKAGNMFIR